MRVHVIQQTVNPSAAPDFVGQHWINTTSSRHWLAKGTSGVGDWVEFTADTDTGITQLTGDVLAGPGSGSQVATISSALTATIASKFAIDLVAISSNTNASVGKTYLCDTSSAAFTLTLPASPALNEFVGVKDAGHAFNTNNLTVARNGKQIESRSNDYICSQNDWAALFVYNGTMWVII